MNIDTHNLAFEQKWGEILQQRRGDEFSLFVRQGQAPATQRQFNLYHYFKLIQRVIIGKGYSSSIEFGCGRATTSLYLHKYERFDVSAFDISNDGVNLARANFDLHEAHGDFFVADSADVPKHDNEYDVAVSIGLLEHLPNYEETLKEMYRVLKPGGMLFTMNIPQKHSVQDLNKWYRAALHLLHPSLPLQKDYFRTVDSAELFKQHAEIVGFKDCKIVCVNPFPLFTPVVPVVERMLAKFYNMLMNVRGLYKKEPMESGPLLSQCHFIIATK